MSTTTSLSQSITGLNKYFLESHAQRKQQVLDAMTTPVLIVNGDNIVLRHQGRRTEYPYMPVRYHELKTLAHLSCSLYNLEVLGNQAMQTACLAEVAQVIQLLKQEDDTHSLKKYLPMLERISEKRFDIGSKTPSDDIQSLITEAAQERLLALHKTTELIRREVGEHPWKSVAVIVLGPPLPREGDIAMQYYAKVLENVHSTSVARCPFHKDMQKSHQRLIYAESIYNEDAALQLLATHIADEVLGSVFLGDPNAMHQDVLKDAGKAYLQEMPLEHTS